VAQDLIYMSAIELLERYRARTLSPVEVTAAVLERVAAVNPTVNAFCLVDEEGALAAARASEERWARGAPLGAVDGVPTTIKDLNLTRGWPTLRGSKTVDPDQDWDEDAPVVARLREHGAVLIGKTTTPEFGWKGLTDSPLTGITRNPWNLAMTPGGSSGGAAVAAMTGMGALHVGSDGGGSIRIPSGFTGNFGLKPSFGRVPAYPSSPFGTVSHVGPMTRTVADAALLLGVIARPDSRDWFSLPYQETDYLAGLDGGIAGCKIAFSQDLGYATVDPEIVACVTAAVGRLEELGAIVERVDPGFACPDAVFNVLWKAGAHNGLKHLNAEQQALLEPELAALVAQGAELTLAQFQDATTARTALGAHMKRFHERYDLLVTPSLAVTAFETGKLAPVGYPGIPDGETNRWIYWTPFSYPFNMTQQPACSVPCGFSSAGLPIGLQIVGPMHRDDLVLRAAHAYEQADPVHRRHPDL